MSVNSDDDEESGIERQSSKGEREEQRAECSKIRAVITQLLQEFNSAENSVEAVYSGRNTSNPNGTKTYADAAQSIIAFEPVLPR
jgi:hypothetical protein